MSLKAIVWAPMVKIVADVLGKPVEGYRQVKSPQLGRSTNEYLQVSSIPAHYSWQVLSNFLISAN